MGGQSTGDDLVGFFMRGLAPFYNSDKFQVGTQNGECFYGWCRAWSSKPAGGVNNALSGFDSHTLSSSAIFCLLRHADCLSIPVESNPPIIGAVHPRRTIDRGVLMRKIIPSLRRANARWGIIALLLGLPLPIVLIAFLFFGGCR